MTTKPLIYCAIDTPDLERATSLAKAVGSAGCGLKLGLEFFNTFGPQGIEKIRNSVPDAPIFLDLKFHDIPNTVAASVKTISTNLSPAYLNVHASGGLEMMQAAKAACGKGTKLLAVTVLTSLDNDALSATGHSLPTFELTGKLAMLAQQAEFDGAVCSALEIQSIRRDCGKDFILMVPGIRPTGSDHGDQKRVMTPQEAIQKGATHLVIGRPITGSTDPAQAAHDILKTLI